jgi:hypothetical protein
MKLASANFFSPIPSKVHTWHLTDHQFSSLTAADQGLFHTSLLPLQYGRRGAHRLILSCTRRETLSAMLNMSR